MADSNFIITRVLVGLYPSLVIRDDAVQPIYKELLEYPELDGFTSYSPPRPFLDDAATLGTLTSSSNLIKVELSRSSVLVSWTNVARAATFSLVPEDVMDLVGRLFKSMNRDVAGMAMLTEFVAKTDEKDIKGVLSPARRKNLQNFVAILTYKSDIGDFKGLDVNYSVSTVVNDAEFATAFKDHKYLLSSNTSMPAESDRVLTLVQAQSFANEILTAQTGEKILADLSDGGE